MSHALTTRNFRRRLIKGAKKQIRKISRAEFVEANCTGVRREPCVPRGKDYADAPKTREKNRRMLQAIKREHPPAGAALIINGDGVIESLPPGMSRETAEYLARSVKDLAQRFQQIDESENE